VASEHTAIYTSNVVLVGAQACNVWWQVGSSATLGGATFAGNVIAAAGSSLGPNATLQGRLLTTIAGGVTLAGNNTVNAAFCAVAPPPGTVGLNKVFSPRVIGPTGVSTLTITLLNPNATAATLTAALVDTLPAGVTVAATPNSSTTCGGGVVTATPGGSSVTLSAGSTIPAGVLGSCTVSVNVTSSTLGTHTNTLGVNALQTSNGSNTTPATALLTVASAVPTLSEWAMIGLAALLFMSGFFALRRRRMAR
jgi:hypothetical protein